MFDLSDNMGPQNLIVDHLSCHSWICTIFRQGQIQQSLVTPLFLMVTVIPHTLAPSGCSLATWQLWSVGRATKPTAICLLSSTNVCGSRLVKVKGVVLGLKYHIAHVYIYINQSLYMCVYIIYYYYFILLYYYYIIILYCIILYYMVWYYIILYDIILYYIVRVLYHIYTIKQNAVYILYYIIYI